MQLAIGERYTHHASPEADALIHQLVGAVGLCVEKAVPQARYHALVLIGGYGRGEGGVRCEGGVERPNNNLDFLLISRNADAAESMRWQREIESHLDDLQKEFGVSIDFSIVAGDSLRRSSCRIMWYDMRFGHKTVLGNPDFVPSLNRFRLERVPTWDVHNLLVNRGTLLVINDCLPSEGDSQETDRIRTRHTIKAVIGYGDALLFAHDQYHWSYAEKQRRMRVLNSVDEAFREIYELAAAHRFRPGNELPEGLSDDREVRRLCESAHLICEAKRLRMADLEWHGYLDKALQSSVWEDPSPRGFARAVRHACRRPSRPAQPNRQAPTATGPAATARLRYASRLGLRALSTQRLLGLLFPAVAYPDCPSGFRELAAELLHAPDPSLDQLRAAYLRTWGSAVDRNFSRFLARFGISIEAQDSQS